jgi:uncharacterized protein
VALDTLRALAAKVDAFFERVQAKQGPDMRCGSGCFDCCSPGLTVTGVEAALVRDGLQGRPPAERTAIAQRARSSDGSRCAALDSQGRCSIYDVRPLVCRSHGLPIRLQTPGHLPIVDACPKNFTAAGPAAVDASCVLDQETLSTMSAAVEAAHARQTGRAAGQRVPLRELLEEAG